MKAIQTLQQTTTLFVKSNSVKLILWLVFVISMQGYTQVFPVQVNPQMIPPYSLKISEYGTAQSERVVVNLLLTDVSDANRRVTLKLYIENNAGLEIRSTDVVIGANPIILDGGTPLRLTNVDLQAYFSLQNLQGIPPQQYNRTLPEGLYRFCFEVFDERSGQPLSRKSCATAYLVLNDPPFLNLPNRGELIPQREPQNIIFQWTPRHLNATNVQYEFTLAEIWDTRMDPQAAFLASRPLYQTTTFANTLLYGPAETPLLPDKKYAWRVRAIITDGISETSVFKNDGYSEIYHFLYTGACDPPSYVLAEAQNPTTQKILWQGADHKQYKVQYRKKSDQDTKEEFVWFENNAYNERSSIYNLEPGTTYEFRVGGMCKENTGFTYSQINEFTTMIAASDTPNYSCGITPEIVITNQKPLEALVINDVFTAGDFPVTVKFVGEGNTASPEVGQPAISGNGYYSGWGYIKVPYLENTKIKVSFNGIKINSDYQLVEGLVLTDYDQNWGGVDDIGNEIEALLNLGDAVIEALNLDITSTTWDRVNQIVTTIIDQIQEENIPDDIKGQTRDAANNIQNASETYSTAQEIYEDENSTEQEKEAAKEQMDAASEDFENAQSNLKEAYESAEKFKKDVANLLKRAIFKIYREGRDSEDQWIGNLQAQANQFNVIDVFEYDQNIQKADEDFEIIFGSESIDISEGTVQFYENDEKLAIYLFAKMLSSEDLEQKVFDGFINEAKKYSVDFIDIVRIGRNENKSDDEILEELDIELRKVFMQILVTIN